METAKLWILSKLLHFSASVPFAPYDRIRLGSLANGRHACTVLCSLANGHTQHLQSEPRQQDGAVPPKTTTTLGGFRLRADPRQLDALSLPTSSSRIDAQQRDKDALAALNAGTTEWTKKTQLHREAAMAPELRALSQALFERETRVVVPPKAKEGSDVGASSTSYEQSLPEMSVTKSRMLASTLDGLPSSNASAPTAKRPLSPVPVKPTSISRSPPTKKKPFTATTRTIPGPRKANQAHVPRPFHQLMVGASRNVK